MDWQIETARVLDTANMQDLRADGSEFAFDVRCRIDTPIEIEVDDAAASPAKEVTA